MKDTSVPPTICSERSTESAATRDNSVGGLSRRAFLIGTAAMGMTSTFSAAAGPVDVTVIGAGFAGLYAALSLQDQGARVRVLEADSRVGGRIRTVTRGGIQFETGGSQVGMGYARLHALAHRFDLALLPPEFGLAPWSINLGGKSIRTADWSESHHNPLQGDHRAVTPSSLYVKALLAAAPRLTPSNWLDDAYQHLDIPLSDWLSAQGFSQAAINLVDQNANYNSVRECSALDALRRFALLREGGRTTFRIAGGNSSLPIAMAAELGDAVYLDKQVAEIATNGNGMQVKCADGTSFDSDFVVCAVPAGPAAQIRFSPALPPLQASVMSQRPYTQITQVHLAPRSAFWEADGFGPSMWTDSALGRVFAITDESGSVAKLTAWINGRAAIAVDRLSREDIAQFVLLEMQRIRPASAGQLSVMEVQSWGRSPLAMGAYAEMSAGTAHQVADAVSRSHGRLHFAGEHTEFAVSGMEAALASGDRAARDILLSV